jgi:DNA-binding ferritin-like protein (Dps family)
MSILEKIFGMNFLEKITGSDMTKKMKGFEARAKVLPAEYQTAWKEIGSILWIHGDFTGRNLMPILDSALELLEVTSADGQSVEEVLGDDIKGFCAALVGDEGAKTYRDKWRDQLNKNVARKLGGLK